MIEATRAEPTSRVRKTAGGVPASWRNRPIGQGGPPPRPAGRAGRAQDPGHVLRSRFRVLGDELVGRGIDGLERHAITVILVPGAKPAEDRGTRLDASAILRTSPALSKSRKQSEPRRPNSGQCRS